MKFKELHTQRLRLRVLSMEDAHEILFLRSNSIVNKFINRPKAKTTIDAVNFINRIQNPTSKQESYYWAICLKNQLKQIGTICLWNFSDDKKTAEIGYELHPDYQRKGIMSEALKTVLEFGFKTLHLETIEAFTHKKNQSSTELLLKHQFKQATERHDTHNENNIVFELKKDRFLF